MKRQLFALMAMMLIGYTTTVWGQTDLSGRTYYHPNILADELNKATKDINKEELRQKGESTYVVKGQQVIMTDSNGEKDTLMLSQDGQYLSGKMDKDTPFKLKRKK